MLRLLKPNSLSEAKWTHKTLPKVLKNNLSGQHEGKSSWNSVNKPKAKEGTDTKKLTL